MTDQGYQVPSETDNVDCHLQRIGMGTLICSAAKTGGKRTNEVSPEICFNCDAGKIYRDMGCDAVLPRLSFHGYIGGVSPMSDGLFCKRKKRDTTLEECQLCSLVVAETTRKLISTARSLFEAQGFFSSYKDLEKARVAIRDGNYENAVTRAVACLESTMRTCHEKLGEQFPNKKQVTDFWKSTRSVLKLEAMDNSPFALLNSLTGAVSHLGSMRNSLGDAHGKGVKPPEVSEALAELAINTASTISTMILRRYIQNKGD